MDAVRGNHLTTTKFLLQEYHCHLEREDSLGRQAIHHASQAGSTKTLDYLVKYGANVNRGASVNSITPLHYAAKVR